jgi:hypothetical protein
MAFTFTTNQTPATGAVAVYTFITRLLAAGFTKVKDSDGTTYSSSGAQITSGASGAGGLGNNSAYVNLRWPSGTREIVIQRGTTDLVWRVTYSPTAFSSGSPSATVVPSGADSSIVLGGGTDGSPTFSSWFSTNGTYRQQMGADSASPYGFWMACYPTGGGAPNAGIVFDPLTSTPVEDTDPVVFHIATTGGNAFTAAGLGSNTASTTTTRVCGWLAFGFGGSFVSLPACTYTATGNVVVPGGLPTNPHNSKDNGIPIFYMRRSAETAPQGYKGQSTLMKWTGTTRTTGTTLASLTRIVLSDVSLPWDGSTTPVL